jgi:adenylate cyclase
MGIETERKFLVKGEFKHLAIKAINIVQLYLLKDPERTIRIRIADDKAFLTIKSSKGRNSISRSEWEFPITISEAEEMMKICIPGKIIKTRYLIPSGNHTFEVDVFRDRNEGLVIAEIELTAEDEQFDKPEWLGEEVTGIPKYFNSNLIK